APSRSRFGKRRYFRLFIGFRRIGMVIGVPAIEFTAAGAVDDDAENVVLAQGLHRASNGIDGGSADTNYQNGAMAQRGKKVRVGGEQQRRAVQNNPIEEAGQMVEHLLDFLQIEQFQWIDDGFSGWHDIEIGVTDSAHGFVQRDLSLQ